jgi:hypothetical protein
MYRPRFVFGNPFAIESGNRARRVLQSSTTLRAQVYAFLKPSAVESGSSRSKSEKTKQIESEAYLHNFKCN